MSVTNILSIGAHTGTVRRKNATTTRRITMHEGAFRVVLEPYSLYGSPYLTQRSAHTFGEKRAASTQKVITLTKLVLAQRKRQLEWYEYQRLHGVECCIIHPFINHAWCVQTATPNIMTLIRSHLPDRPSCSYAFLLADFILVIYSSSY